MSWPVWEWEGEGPQGEEYASFSIERNGPDHYWVTINQGDSMAMVFLPADVVLDMASRVGLYAREQAEFVRQDAADRG